MQKVLYTEKYRRNSNNVTQEKGDPVDPALRPFARTSKSIGQCAPAERQMPQENRKSDHIGGVPRKIGDMDEQNERENHCAQKCGGQNGVLLRDDTECGR